MYRELIITSVLIIGCNEESFQASSSGGDSTAPATHNRDVVESGPTETEVASATQAGIVNGTCSGDDVAIYRKTLNFANNWGQGCEERPGNGPFVDNCSVVARNIQTATFDMPEDLGEICSMKLVSNSTNYSYDDHMYMTLNNRMLMTTEHRAEDMISSGMQEDDAGINYDWTSLRNADLCTWTVGSYCHDSFSCSIAGQRVPAGSSYTTLDSLEIETKAGFFTKLPDNYRTMTHELTIHVAGSRNAKTDCNHTGLNFDLSISYIRK